MTACMHLLAENWMPVSAELDASQRGSALELAVNKQINQRKAPTVT